MSTTTVTITAEEQRALDEIRTRLAAKFPAVDPSDIESAVADAHRRFDSGRIRDFVPLFVERDALSRLTAAHS